MPESGRTRSRGTVRATDLGLPEHPACPFCAGTDTELHAPFGSALSVATYWCHRCRTAFEWFKQERS
ncbi:MAG TPA: hypothetical protein VF188_01740 [Longimicrobiales bacterium]